jgi:hypothetical protein
MPDASEELITTQSEIANGTRQAQPSGRLPSLLVGRPRRNGSGSASGPCLGGSSGRGIGATAPGALARLPPPLRRHRHLLAATAAGSSLAGRSAATPGPKSF